MSENEKPILNHKSPQDITNQDVLEDAVEMFLVANGSERYRHCVLCGEKIDCLGYQAKKAHMINYHAILSGNKIIGWDR